MSLTIHPRAIQAFALGLALTACADPPTSAVSADVAGPAMSANDRTRGRFDVRMLDNCFGDSWEPVGGCAINGSVTRLQFQASLTAIGYHPDWRNDPVFLDVQPNAKLRVVNAGGRNHTFTRVTAFGGGYMPNFNRLPDMQVIAPGCELPDPAAVMVPGETREFRTDRTGAAHRELYQCCIHPWMRTTVNVTHSGH